MERVVSMFSRCDANEVDIGRPINKKKNDAETSTGSTIEDRLELGSSPVKKKSVDWIDARRTSIGLTRRWDHGRICCWDDNK